MRRGFKKITKKKIFISYLYVIFFITLFKCFHNYGYFGYKFIPRADIQKYLYKKINVNLPKLVGKPDCKYDKVLSSQYYCDDYITYRFDDFSAEGIYNGSFYPKHCNALFSTAIIIVYRNRPEKLNMFLIYMHNFLRRQDIHYRIFIVDQKDRQLFNRGVLSNIGAKYALGHGYPCIIFHEIDIVPLDDSNLYACLNQPRHMSAAVDTERYILPADDWIKGAFSIQAEQYQLINGFSNRFFGFGVDDTDLYLRLKAYNLHILRFPREMSRYKRLITKRKEREDYRFAVMEDNSSLSNIENDGYNTLSDDKYEAVVDPYMLYTRINVDLEKCC